MTEKKDVLTVKPNRELAEQHMDGFIRSLGFNPDTDPHFKGTAKRVTKMYIEELFAGAYKEPPHVTSFDDPDIAASSVDAEYSGGLIYSGPLRVRSTCSHHLLPITGEAHVALILQEGASLLPGLSKYGRIVDYFSSRPQVQERLTQQIADHLGTVLPVKGLGVMVRAKHMCQCHRGMQQTDAQMITTALRGIFKLPEVRAEFMSTIEINMLHR